MDLSKWLQTDKPKQVALVVGAVIFLVMFSVALKSCYDNRVISQHETEVKAEVLEKAQKSNDAASDARAKDTISNQKKNEERKDAIAKATDEPPSDASKRLGCERLRQAGYDTSRIPACAGY